LNLTGHGARARLAPYVMFVLSYIRRFGRLTYIRKKKEFITLHIAVDAKSEKIVSFRVTKRNVHDSKKFSPIVREVSEGYDIDKVYADKAHDNRRSFNLLDNLNIEPAIQIRKNASIAATVAQRSPMFMFALLLCVEFHYCLLST
jgi:uncharacterized protein YlbG (UPF0298 family)